MTLDRWWSRGPWVLAVLAVGAGGLRVWPFLTVHGALGYPVDYDEGVYFSASALLFQGLLPYRDFLFVHPPGSLVLWGAAAGWVSGWDAASGFVLARWLAACVGALNVWWVGRLALRAWGPVAGLFAALVYATYPEVVLVERGPFLEPFLNLACLAMAWVWLAPPRPGREFSQGLWAGVLGGLAVSVKLLGGLWIAAAVLSRAPRSGGRAPLGLLVGAGGAGLVLVGPFLAASPTALLADVLLFQSQRPGDGDVDRLSRLHQMLPEPRAVGVGLVLVGLGVALARAWRADSPSRPAERLFAFAYAVTVAAFLASPSYWNQYNAHLAASESLLAGLGAAAIHGGLRAWRPAWARGALGVLAVAGVLVTAKPLRAGARQRTKDLVTLGSYLRRDVPADAPVCAFEPAWGVSGGRLPPRLPGAPVLVDSYALMLQDALATGERFPNADAAFHASASQRAIRSVLERCRFVVLGGRGAWQLSEESQRWFHERFAQRFPAPGQGGFDVWERLENSPSTAP